MPLSIVSQSGSASSKPIDQIADGAYFVGKIGTAPDRLFLKVTVNSTATIISLEDPTKVWIDPVTSVTNYRDADIAARITIL